jgi:hypothetical protein
MKKLRYVLLAVALFAALSLGFNVYRNSNLSAQSAGTAGMPQGCLTPGNLCTIITGVSDATGTTASTLLAAAGTGLRYYVTEVGCINTTTQGTYADLRNGTNTSPAWTVPCPASGAIGSITTYPVPIRMSSTNTTLNMAMGLATNKLIYTMKAYRAP